MAIPVESFYAQGPGPAKNKTPPPSDRLPAPTTPISFKSSGCDPYETGAHLRSSLNRRLAMETKGHYLGAMQPLKFIQRFFPTADMPDSKEPNPFAAVKSDTMTNELQMYDPFIKAAAPLAPSLTFYNTHSNGDRQCNKLSADVSAYKASDLPEANQTDFSRMELFAEFKFDDNADPFIDPMDLSFKNFEIERDSGAARLLRGQLSSYVAAMTGSQFRTHVFTILICGKSARLMYWDRNGAVVSRAFNYAKDNYLGLFLHHFNKDIACRGHDPTVYCDHKAQATQVTRSDREKMENKRHREYRIMLIPDRDDAKLESEFLISYPPKYTTHSPFGRATRPMVAYDLRQRRLVFVKDYWRPVGSDKEGDIYKILVEKNVPHIAPFGKGNDVRKNVTLTDQLRKERWACRTCEMVPLCNYRMSLDEIGRRLTEFKSPQEFVGAVANAMEAHDAAYFDAQILHRDISLGNVIITFEGEGLLIDWDLCIKLQETDAVARRPKRTGTWQFMSAALLSNADLNQGIEDDRESAFYVLLYLALRYTRHDQVQKKLETYMEMFDYVTIGSDNLANGGDLKSNFLTNPTRLEALTFECKPLEDLVKELRTTFNVRYMDSPSAAAFENYEAMKSNPDIPPDFYKYHPVAQYETHTHNLKERNWLVDILEKYYDDPIAGLKQSRRSTICLT